MNRENIPDQDELQQPEWVVASTADPETGVAWAKIEPGQAAAYLDPDYILLRGPDGDRKGFTDEEMKAFIAGIKDGEFDLPEFGQPEQ